MQLSFTAEGKPDTSTGLLLYTACYHAVDAMQSTRYQICQYHDPCTPLRVQHGVFTRWNQGKQTLDFYNGSLRRILAGMEPGELDIQHFALDEPFEIVRPVHKQLIRKEGGHETG